MGLFDIFKKKNKEPNIDVSVELKVNQAMMDEARRRKEEYDAKYRVEKDEGIRTLEPPAPCGFSFDDVYVQTERVFDRETDTIVKDICNVTLEGNNLDKVAGDMTSLIPFAKEVSDVDSNWISLGGYIHDIIARDDIREAWLSVKPLTPTGKIKKFPIEAIIHLMDIEPDTSFIANLSYLSNGTIGKATLIQWKDHRGIKVDLVRVSDDYILKSVDINPDARDGDVGWVRALTT